MKSKTKKLFLSLFAFVGLSLAACSGGGDSSSSGGGSSSGSSSSQGSSSSETSSEEESSEEEDSSEESSGEETYTHTARLTSGNLSTTNVTLVHVWGSSGADTVTGEVNGAVVTFTLDTTAFTKFIVCELKPGETTLGENWVNVAKQSRELSISDSQVDFDWKPNADDNYHLWGSTDGTNWDELGKFTETAGVYTATVTLAKDTEFVFHLEAYSTEDAGWRNFADLVGTGVTGNFKAKGGTGDDKNNIIVDTAGEYTFTVTNEHKVQVGSEAPVVSTDYYVRGTAVGGWDVAAANKLLAPTEDTQIGYISNLALAEGEFVIANNDYSHKWGFLWNHGDGDVKNIIGGAAANFVAATGEDNNIKCNVAGNYDIYLMKNNYISIESHATPVPENCVWGSAGGAAWANLGTITEGSVTVTLAVNDEFVFHVEGGDYRNITDLSGSLADKFQAKGGTGDDKNNIVCKEAGTYTFAVAAAPGHGSVVVGTPIAKHAVTFTVTKCPTEDGLDVYLMGTVNSWAINSAYKLNWVSDEGTHDATWSAAIQLEEGELEYKFAIYNKSTEVVTYEAAGDNRILNVTAESAQNLEYGNIPVVVPTICAYLDLVEQTAKTTKENPSNAAEYEFTPTADATLTLTKNSAPLMIIGVDGSPLGTPADHYDCEAGKLYKVYVKSDYEVWIVTPDMPTARTLTATTGSSSDAWFLSTTTIKIFAYYWGGTSEPGWVLATNDGTTATFEIPTAADHFLLVRCEGDTVTPDWLVRGDKPGRIYNKCSDITITSETNYVISIPTNNAHNGPERLLKVTRGTNVLYFGAYSDGGTQYPALNVPLQAHDKLSAVNNDTDIGYDITVESGAASLYDSVNGVVNDGTYNIYIKTSNQFWIAVAS